MGLRKVLSSKIFIFFAGVLLIFMGINLGKELYRKYQIQKEIDSLQSEVNDLKSSNQQLADLISYFKTENFAEIEARKKLNLQKEDEQVVVVNVSEAESVKNATSTKKDNENVVSSEAPQKKKSNIQKWWDYFFNKN